MVEEKEPKGITRRQFLKGITALGASALLSSCGVKEKPSGEEPTKAPSPTETGPSYPNPCQNKRANPYSFSRTLSCPGDNKYCRHDDHCRLLKERLCRYWRRGDCYQRSGGSVAGPIWPGLCFLIVGRRS
ncbi:MAG: twin-arginine translocation signal domain-containing protein [Patescibacteria group bacterium]